MSKITKSKIFFLAILFFGVFALAQSSQAADSENLQVTKIHRISHPAYTMINLWETIRSPWNVDYSRIMLYESDYTEHPDFEGARETGRNTIWGCISSSCVNSTPATSTLQDLDLDNASVSDKKLTAWDSNTFAFPSTYRPRVHWSPYSGESNIVYALNSTTKMLVTYNVDTGVETSIMSYDHTSGVAYAEIIGFSKDATTGSLGHQHELVVKLNYNYVAGLDHGPTYRFFTDRQSNGTFGTPTRTYEDHALSCDAKMVWYPQPSGIHGGVSPDGLYAAAYWGMTKNDFDGDVCIKTSPWELNADRYWQDADMYSQELGQTHLCWNASNDWYITGSENTEFFQTHMYAPKIITETIYQVLFNRVLAETRANNNCPDCFIHNLLISRQSAGLWSNNTLDDTNYGAMPSPTVSFNGQYLYFHGTNGKYTNADHDARPDITGPTNWEGPGAYMADLAPASSGNDTTPPAAPQGLMVQ